MALQAWLRQPGLARPVLVDGPGPAPAADAAVGWLDTDQPEAELFVGHAPGHRLAWTPADPDRRRTLAAGEHPAGGYRLFRAGEGGARWMLSGTGTAFRRVTVRAGETSRVALDPRVHLAFTLHPHRKGIVISAGLTGDHGAGISIYKDGKRIALTWRAQDAEGKTLAEGPLAYG